MIEVAFNVALYPPSYSVHISFNRFKGRMTAPFWSEPMRVLREDRFINGFQDELKDSAQELIPKTGHPQSTLPHHPHEFRDG